MAVSHRVSIVQDVPPEEHEAHAVLMSSAAMTASPTPPILPIEIDPQQPSHAAELRRHRIACGWNAELVPEWMEEIKSGVKRMWLYYLPHPSPLEISNGHGTSPQHQDRLPHESRAIGSASLTRKEMIMETVISNNGPDTLTICSLFVFPAFRSARYGSSIMAHLEETAFSTSPEVQWVSLNTLAKKVEVKKGPLHWYKDKRGYLEYLPRMLGSELLDGEDGIDEGDEMAFLRLGREVWLNRWRMT